MPSIANNSLDEEVSWDVSPEFRAGMFSNSRANLLAANQCAYLQNIDLGVSGELTTRRGTKRLGQNLAQQIQGIAFYKTPSTERLVLAASSEIGNTVVYTFDGSSWVLANGEYQLLANGPVTFVQGVDKLFIAQEDQPLRYFENDIVSTYQSDDNREITYLSFAALTTSIPQLDSLYFTIYDANGSAYVWFNVDSGSVDPAPVGFSRGIEVALPANYRSRHRKTIVTAIVSAINSDGLWTAKSIGGTQCQITDASLGRRTDASLGTLDGSGVTLSVIQQGETANLAPPVGLKYLVWHTSRLAGAGNADTPDTIYFSQFLDGSTWDRTQWNVRIGAGEGDPITGLASWTQYNLVVFKQHSTWVVDCNPTEDVADFVIHRVHDRIGCPAWRTACQVGTDIFFLSDSGVRSVKNILASEQQKEVGPALSYPIDDYIKRITPTAIETACAFHWENRYILAVPLDGASQPNAVFVYNTLTDGWTIWKGIRPVGFAARVDAGTKKLWFGQADGRVTDWMDYVLDSQASETAYEDDGADIESVVVTKAYTCGEPIATKNGLNTVLEFNKSYANVDSVAIKDAGAEERFESFSTAAASLSLPLTLPFTLPVSGVVRKPFGTARYNRWNELQLKMVSPSKKLSLRSISMSAFINPLQLQ